VFKRDYSGDGENYNPKTIATGSDVGQLDFFQANVFELHHGALVVVLQM
jgi:hypothetical protein